MALEFTVFGSARPQGSKTPFKLPNGKIVLVEAAKGHKEWRSKVSLACKMAQMDQQDITPKLGAMQLNVHFIFERPKTVTRAEPTVPADLDKLVRNIGDALTGLAYKDDAQIVQIMAKKSYGPVAMTAVSVTEL